jgi:hypothetical protein
MKSNALIFFIFVLSSLFYVNTFASSTISISTNKQVYQKQQLLHNSISNQSELTENFLLEIADDDINDSENEKNTRFRSICNNSAVKHPLGFSKIHFQKFCNTFLLQLRIPLFIFIRVIRL